MNMNTFMLAALTGLAGLTAIATSAEEVSLPRNPPTAWKKECTNCHTGFPPQMMRVTDWKQLMSGLEKHFGTDASVSKKDEAVILAFLTDNAVADINERRAAKDMRVTSTTFFQREHRDFIPDLFKHPDIKSAANCEACHRTPGEYGHTVTLPPDMKLPPKRGRMSAPPTDPASPPAAIPAPPPTTAPANPPAQHPIS